MKFLIAVDDPRSYELIENFEPYYEQFKSHMVFEIHLRIFRKNLTNFMSFQPQDCVGEKAFEYCTTKSYEDGTHISGLGLETLRHICLKQHDIKKYFQFVSLVK